MTKQFEVEEGQVAVSSDEITATVTKLCTFFQKQKIAPVLAVTAMLFLSKKVATDLGMTHAATVVVDRKSGKEVKRMEGKGEAPTEAIGKIMDFASKLDEEVEAESASMHTLH